MQIPSRLRGCKSIEILARAVDRRGHFAVELDGEIICNRSRQPLLDSARLLLALGYDIDAMVFLFRDGTLSVFGRLGVAAALTVEECSDGRPRFRRWKAPPPSEGSSPIGRKKIFDKRVGAAA